MTCNHLAALYNMSQEALDTTRSSETRPLIAETACARDPANPPVKLHCIRDQLFNGKLTHHDAVGSQCCQNSRHLQKDTLSQDWQRLCHSTPILPVLGTCSGVLWYMPAVAIVTTLASVLVPTGTLLFDVRKLVQTQLAGS